MRARPAAAIVADTVGAGRRVEPREQLQTVVALHLESGETIDAVLTDLSTRGCRVATVPRLPEQAHVTVIGRSAMVGGRVSWSAEGAAGIEFGARLLAKTMRNLGG